MTESDAARAFLRGEVEALEPFDFVAAGPAGKPLHMVEVTRTEQGLEVRVPGRPPVVPEVPVPTRAALRDRGFASEDPSDRRRPWVRSVADADEAVRTVHEVLTEVFGEKPELRLDVAHGSHRAAHEARQKVAAVRDRVERVVARYVDGRPADRDGDGDYTLPVGDVQVVVAPRAVPDGPVLVRVFAVCNVGVNVVPELGLFLARLNFSLMFGRFALDAENRSVWFDETLVGEGFSDDELGFTIDVVAATADQWDDRLKQMFGGATYQEMLSSRGDGSVPRLKPGSQDAPELPGRGLYL